MPDVAGAVGDALDVAAGGVVGVTAGDAAGDEGSLPPQAEVTKARDAAPTTPKNEEEQRRIMGKILAQRDGSPPGTGSPDGDRRGPRRQF
jgi:hypothetical protein